MEKIVKKDPLTGETFVPKRSNQRFATSYNRKKFNNQSANLLRKKRDVIYAPLNKTHRIIIELMEGKNEADFNNEFLRGCGASFLRFSHFIVIDGRQCNCIFEFIITFNNTSNTTKIERNGRF
jgi:hypothetical protein